MLISLLVSLMSYQYGPDLVMVYTNEVLNVLVQGVLVNINSIMLQLPIVAGAAPTSSAVRQSSSADHSQRAESLVSHDYPVS